MRFSKKAFAVTGAAKGIGRAIAERLAKEGAKVLLLDTDRAQGEATAKRLKGRGTFLACDLAIPAAIQAAAARLPRLDGLVNNAGIGAFKPLWDLKVEEWDRVINVNLRAAWLCTKLFLPKFKPNAAIVNIASTRALMSEPHGEAYGASKGGLLALTHAMALSLQPKKMRVNAIAPGWIDTGYIKIRPRDHAQHPAGRVGRPGDVAEAACYLLDKKASGFMTGQALVLDGGMTRKMIYVD